jgi:hypothetical protein
MRLLRGLVVVVLGSLIGCAEASAMDSESVSGASLEFAGLILAAFLLYLALSDFIRARFGRQRWQTRPVRRSLSEAADATDAPNDEALDARQGVSADAMR